MKVLFTVLFALIGLFLTGCFSPTATKVIEYGADGKVIKVTETGESVIKSITESVKDKSCITWESGWVAYVSASTATTEDPTPTFKMGVGKADKGVITLHKDHTELQKNVAEIIRSTRQDLEVTKDGLSATGEKTEK